MRVFGVQGPATFGSPRASSVAFSYVHLGALQFGFGKEADQADHPFAKIKRKTNISEAETSSMDGGPPLSGWKTSVRIRAFLLYVGRRHPCSTVNFVNPKVENPTAGLNCLVVAASSLVRSRFQLLIRTAGLGVLKGMLFRTVQALVFKLAAQSFLPPKS